MRPSKIEAAAASYPTNKCLICDAAPVNVSSSQRNSLAFYFPSLLIPTGRRKRRAGDTDWLVQQTLRSYSLQGRWWPCCGTGTIALWRIRALGHRDGSRSAYRVNLPLNVSRSKASSIGERLKKGEWLSCEPEVDRRSLLCEGSVCGSLGRSG